MNNNTCINCIHKEVCYKYRLNYVGTRGEGNCTDYKGVKEIESIFVVSVREEIKGEDVAYHRYFSSEEKAETFINDNLKGQIVMSLSEEGVT